jgi:hypothetical protein
MLFTASLQEMCWNRLELSRLGFHKERFEF